MKVNNATLGTLVILLVMYSGPAKAQVDAPDSAYHSCFFEEKSFSIGLAAEQVLSARQSGGQARFYYNIRENICFGPEMGLIGDVEAHSSDYNMVIHYVQEVLSFGVYPVAGFNYSRETEEAHTRNGIGPMAGIGLHRNWKKAVFFSEYTYSFALSGSDKISLGFMYMFKL